MKHIILSGDDKGKSIDVRPMTISELKALSYGDRVLVYTGYFGRNRLGGLVHVKVNGKPKTWKTRPSDVSIPIKYGLYEYERIEYRDGAMVDRNLWIATQA
jgi:hypothetical protein